MDDFFTIVTLPNQGLRGREVTSLISACLLTLVILCAYPLYAQDLKHSRPNIVIITTDQQSADAMSFRMGKQWINTPNMDSLASQGTFFTRAYAANPLCVPSRNSMVTGRFPHEIGVQANSDLANWWGDSQKAPNYWTGKDHKSLGTYFKNAGYETAYFGKWHLNYKKADRQSHGFERVRTFPKPENDAAIPGAVDTFLTQSGEKPLLLWASFVNPHDICQWARFQQLPEGPIGKIPPVGEWPPLKKNLAPPKNETKAMSLARKSYTGTSQFPVGDYSNFDWRRLAWGYYRLIEKVDHQIGQLLKVLEENGYDENTLILFTSDHGESLGAHSFNQKTVFYEESARVPFIIKYPGKVTRGRNKTLVNTGTDLLPTLLDFAGITPSDRLPGISLKESAENGRSDNSRPFIVVENKMVQGGPVNGTKPVVNGRMVRGERYKYCLYDTLRHREALFDLEKDPGETINIAEKESSEEIVAKYRRYLHEFGTVRNDTLALRMLNYLNTK